MALPASIVVALLGDETVRVLLGPSWVPLQAAFSVMVFGMFFRTSYKLSDSLARATGAVYRRAWRQGVYAAAVVGGAFIGHSWGIRGVAIGVLAAVITNFLLMAHLALDLVDMSWPAFALAHTPALVVSAALVVTVGPTAVALRAVGAPAIVVLGCGLMVATAVTVLVVRLAPSLRFKLLANVVQATLGLVPARAGVLAGAVVRAGVRAGSRGGVVTSDDGPIRIAFVITRSDIIGGASLHVRHLATSLQHQGHDVLVVVGGHGPFVAELRATGLRVAALPRFQRAIRPGADLRTYFALRRELAAFDPHVVSTHTSKAGALGRLAARSLGVPATYSPHGWTFAEERGSRPLRAAYAASSACSRSCPGRS